MRVDGNRTQRSGPVRSGPVPPYPNTSSSTGTSGVPVLPTLIRSWAVSGGRRDLIGWVRPEWEEPEKITLLSRRPQASSCPGEFSCKRTTKFLFTFSVSHQNTNKLVEPPPSPRPRLTPALRPGMLIGSLCLLLTPVPRRQVGVWHIGTNSPDIHLRAI